MMNRLTTRYDLHAPSPNLVTGTLCQLDMQGEHCHLVLETAAGLLHHTLPAVTVQTLGLYPGQLIQLKLDVTQISVAGEGRCQFVDNRTVLKSIQRPAIQ